MQLDLPSYLHKNLTSYVKAPLTNFYSSMKLILIWFNLQSRAKLAEQEARMSLLRGMASNRMTNEQKEELERITPAKFVKSSDTETEIVPSTRCLKSKYRF